MKITIVIEHEGEPCTNAQADQARQAIRQAARDIMLVEIRESGKALLLHGADFIKVRLEVAP